MPTLVSTDISVGKRTYSKQSPLQRLTSSRTSVLQFGRPLRRHFFKTDVLEDVRFANSDVLEDVRFFAKRTRSSAPRQWRAQLRGGLRGGGLRGAGRRGAGRRGGLAERRVVGRRVVGRLAARLGAPLELRVAVRGGALRPAPAGPSADCRLLERRETMRWRVHEHSRCAFSLAASPYLVDHFYNRTSDEFAHECTGKERAVLSCCLVSSLLVSGTMW